MLKRVTWGVYRTKALYRSYKIKKFNSAKNYSCSLKKYVGRDILSADEINTIIYNNILSGKPFMVGRFGATELLNMQSFDFGAIGKYGIEYRFKQLCDWSGFFPNDINLIYKFVEIMKESCRSVDIISVWFNAFEDFYIKKYMKDKLFQTYLLDFEPWSSEKPWSAALKGKKVLVIHPFEDTIKNQYLNREYIFQNTEILPEFELKTLKAVQTLAGTSDNRFKDWFQALEYMYDEAMNIDFDIAIIGCGAYGFPLASKIKESGKQAIHLAGATQLLFGIKGKRWCGNKEFEYVSKYFNDYWVYPQKSDKIRNSNKVEDSCYW